MYLIILILFIINTVFTIWILLDMHATDKNLKKDKIVRSFTQKEWDEQVRQFSNQTTEYAVENCDVYSKGTAVVPNHEHKAHTVTLIYKGVKGYLTLPDNILFDLWYNNLQSKMNAESETKKHE